MIPLTDSFLPRLLARGRGGGSSPGVLLPCPVALGVLLHSLEARVVVGELVQMSERDLGRDVCVVVADVGELVVQPLTSDSLARTHVRTERLRPESEY